MNVTFSIGTPDHYEITKLIYDLPSGEVIKLGEALGLGYPKLEKMKNLHHDMVAAWLRQEDDVIERCGDPTWKSLAKALNEIGQCGKAKKIHDSYI